MGDPCARTILSVPNGLSAPLYAEGQVVRAADLTLDRSSHDAELWRLRRYLHGWGVVAGLVPEIEGSGLILHRGYGICPSGEEVLLPETMKIGDLAAEMLRACGPDAAGCALDAAPATGPDANAPLAVWLVIRPQATLADPRPALMRGCDHPGNNVAPARLCRGVAVELCCTLPDGHGRPAPDCAAMREILCNNQPVFMPDDLPEPGLLVLAKITYDGAEFTLDTGPRRPLLPVSILQDFILACGCQTPVPDPQPIPQPVPQPDRKAELDYDWQRIAELAQQKQPPDKPDPVIRPDYLDKLVAAGVKPVEVLTGNPALLAEKTGLAVQQITDLSVALAPVRNRINQVGF